MSYFPYPAETLWSVVLIIALCVLSSFPLPIHLNILKGKKQKQKHNHTYWPHFKLMISNLSEALMLPSHHTIVPWSIHYPILLDNY